MGCLKIKAQFFLEGRPLEKDTSVLSDEPWGRLLGVRGPHSTGNLSSLADSQLRKRTKMAGKDTEVTTEEKSGPALSERPA